MIQGGLTGLLVGAPGTGKSTLLGSVAEVEGVERICLLAPMPREINSFKYLEHRDKIDPKVFQDIGWHPTLDKFEAGAFSKMYEYIVSLYEDEVYDAVLLDNYGGAVSLASHELLAPEKAATPKACRDSRSYYGSLKYKLSDFTTALTGLGSIALKKPKHVFVAVHAQPVSEDEQAKTQGIEHLGNVQPMVEGGHRHNIAGAFDIVGFTKIKHENKMEGGKLKKQTSYVVQLNADPERHAKAAIVPRLEAAEVPNNMRAIFGAIEEAFGA